MDRFDDLVTFLAVADAGSLSAAGRRMGAPLPTVSRKIAALERRLGAQLFLRTSRRAELTDAGRELAAAARVILDQLEAAEQAAAGEYQEPRGELAITAPMRLGELHVAPLAGDFLKEHPKIDLRLVFSDAPLNLIESGVHVGVRIGAVADESLMVRRIGGTRALTCASPDYLGRRGVPRTPEELAEHDGVSFRGAASLPWRYVRDGRAIVAAPRGRVAVNSAAAAVGAAAAGLGIARALDYQVTEALCEGTLLRLLEPFEAPPLPISVVFTAQARLPLKVRAFVDWLVPRLRARLAAGQASVRPHDI